MTAALPCPHCGKVLRTTQAPPAGARVKCPACGQSFAAGAAAPPPRATAAPPTVPRPPVRVLPRLAAAGLGLLGMLFLLTAFVWPGFLRGRPAPLPAEPLAYVDPAVNVLLGANVDTLRAKGMLPAVLDWLRTQAANRGPRALLPVLNALGPDAATVLLVGKSDDRGRTVLVLQTRAPLDPERVSHFLPPDDGQPLPRGAAVARVSLQGETAWLALPGERLLVLGTDQPAVYRALDAGRRGEAPPIMSLARGVDAAPGWGVVLFDAALRDQFRRDPALQKNVAVLRTTLPALLPPVERATAATVRVFNLTGPLAPTDNIRLDLHCASAADAASLHATAEQFWNSPLRPFTLTLMPTGIPAPLLNDLNASLALAQDGPVVSAYARPSRAAVQALVDRLP